MDFRGNKQSATDQERNARHAELTLRVNNKFQLQNLENQLYRLKSFKSHITDSSTWVKIGNFVEQYRRVKNARKESQRFVKSTSQTLVDLLKRNHPDAFQIENRPHTYGVTEDSKDLLANVFAELTQRLSAAHAAEKELDLAFERLSNIGLVKTTLLGEINHAIALKERELDNFKRATGIVRIGGLALGAHGEAEVRVRVETGVKRNAAVAGLPTPPPPPPPAAAPVTPPAPTPVPVPPPAPLVVEEPQQAKGNKGPRKLVNRLRKPLTQIVVTPAAPAVEARSVPENANTVEDLLAE
jgi:hypothetical protein